MATKTQQPGAVNITEADRRLITPAEARQFSERLYKALLFAEVADMRLARLAMAHQLDELGGWPEGYEFSTEAVAAFSILADSLEREAERMTEWAQRMRFEAAHLWFVRGPEGEEHDAS